MSEHVVGLLLPFRLPVVFGSNCERIQISLIPHWPCAFPPLRALQLMPVLLLQTVFSHFQGCQLCVCIVTARTGS